MKLGNHQLIGPLFLPTLALAACALTLGYWFSRRKTESSKPPNPDTDKQSNGGSQIIVEKPKVEKKKKKKSCGCGSGDHTHGDIPSKIEIIYSSLTGKSKVN